MTPEELKVAEDVMSILEPGDPVYIAKWSGSESYSKRYFSGYDTTERLVRWKCRTSSYWRRCSGIDRVDAERTCEAVLKLRRKQLKTA